MPERRDLRRGRARSRRPGRPRRRHRAPRARRPAPPVAQPARPPPRRRRTGLTLDLGRKKLRIDGETAALTYREFELLQFLVLREGRTVARTEIIDDAVVGRRPRGAERAHDRRPRPPPARQARRVRRDRPHRPRRRLPLRPPCGRRDPLRRGAEPRPVLTRSGKRSGTLSIRPRHAVGGSAPLPDRYTFFPRRKFAVADGVCDCRTLLVQGMRAGRRLCDRPFPCRRRCERSGRTRTTAPRAAALSPGTGVRPVDPSPGAPPLARGKRGIRWARLAAPSLASEAWPNRMRPPSSGSVTTSASPTTPRCGRRSTSGRPVVCVYVLDDSGGAGRALGGASRWWLHHSLDALDASLRKRGARLLLRHGDGAEEIAAVLQQTGAGLLTMNRRYAHGEREQDDRVRRAAERAGVRRVDAPRLPAARAGRGAERRRRALRRVHPVLLARSRGAARRAPRSPRPCTIEGPAGARWRGRAARPPSACCRRRPTGRRHRGDVDAGREGRATDGSTSSCTHRLARYAGAPRRARSRGELPAVAAPEVRRGQPVPAVAPRAAARRAPGGAARSSSRSSAGGSSTTTCSTPIPTSTP